MPCFAQGATSRDHDPATHAFSVIEQHSIPIYTKDWGADEEHLLLEGAEVYGLGSWAEIADHIGGYRSKEEVREHYIKIYIESSKFPLPERADPKDLSLLEEVPREKFQARKKRRIEECKEAARSAPPVAPKPKPTASVPSCHEVQGYMPGRLEFETEFANEAEEVVQSMQFDPGDGINPRTGELELEVELKLVVMDIYNSRLTARAERKKIIFEHNLLEYRKNAAMDKKRTKEERDLLNKAKPFARFMNETDFREFSEGLLNEHNLRQAIEKLQEWRLMGIATLKAGAQYEQEKLARAQRPPPTGSFDRLAGIRAPKPTAPVETSAAVMALLAPELPEHLKPKPPQKAIPMHLKPTTANGTSNPPPSNSTTSRPPPFTATPLSNMPSIKLTPENATDLQLLTKEESELCAYLRLMPKPYLVIKDALLTEAIKTGGAIKKKVAKEILKVSRLFTLSLASQPLGGMKDALFTRQKQRNFTSRTFKLITNNISRLTLAKLAASLTSSFIPGGFLKLRYLVQIPLACLISTS